MHTIVCNQFHFLYCDCIQSQLQTTRVHKYSLWVLRLKQDLCWEKHKITQYLQYKVKLCWNNLNTNSISDKRTSNMIMSYLQKLNQFKAVAVQKVWPPKGFSEGVLHQLMAPLKKKIAVTPFGQRITCLSHRTCLRKVSCSFIAFGISPFVIIVQVTCACMFLLWYDAVIMLRLVKTNYHSTLPNNNM